MAPSCFTFCSHCLFMVSLSLVFLTFGRKKLCLVVCFGPYAALEVIGYQNKQFCVYVLHNHKGIASYVFVHDHCQCLDTTAAMTEGGDRLYLTTPVIHSSVMSQKANLDIYLKLENLQPPGSFKIRGISNMCQTVCHVCSFCLDRGWEKLGMRVGERGWAGAR